MKIEGTDVKTKIMPLYLKGKTIQEIADEFCIRSNYKLINAIEVFIYTSDNPKELYKERIYSISDYDLYLLYKQGVSDIQISKMYNIKPTDVKDKIISYCNMNNIMLDDIMKTRGVGEKEDINKSKNEKFLKQLEKEFKEGKTLLELSEKYNYSIYTIRKKLNKVMLQEEIKEIIDSRRSNRKSFSEEEADFIVYLYESGLENKTEIAKKYNTNIKIIENLLLKEYKKRGIDYIPSVARKTAFLNLMYKEHFTRDEIIESAKNAKKVIPPQFLEEYYEKNANLYRIRKYVINQYTMEKQDEGVEIENNSENNFKEYMFKSFNIASILKKNGYNHDYQAVAILYLLPQLTGATLEELNKVVDGNEEIIDAIKILNLETTEEGVYLQNLQKNNIASRVKIAEKIEEIKQATLENTIINLANYSRYYELAKETELKKEFSQVIEENNSLIKIKGGEEH